MIRKSLFSVFLLAGIGFCVCTGFAPDASAQTQDEVKREIQQLKQMMQQMQSRIEDLEEKNRVLEQQAKEREEEVVVVEETEEVSVTEERVATDEPFGGEFAITIGAQTGPFKTGTGFYMAGELGVPLFRNAGPGKVMGLINIGWAKTDDDLTFEPTVNAIAPGALPTQTSVNLTTVSIILGLKYKLEMHPIVQPYVLGGPGFDIFLNDSDPGNNVGGIAPQPSALQNRGYPSGQGNVELGLHTGGGVDFNLTKRIFVGAEGRFNWVDRDNGVFGTYGGRVGFRF